VPGIGSGLFQPAFAFGENGADREQLKISFTSMKSISGAGTGTMQNCARLFVSLVVFFAAVDYAGNSRGLERHSIL